MFSFSSFFYVQHRRELVSLRKKALETEEKKENEMKTTEKATYPEVNVKCA